jgi:hypothetical protein
MPKKALLSVLLILCRCGNPLPVLENVNLADWKADRNGCQGKRASMEQALQNQKEKLVALSETQVIALLGMPDQNELYKRNQKFFYYFITASPACQSPAKREIKLGIRFNAVGLAKEITIE